MPITEAIQKIILAHGSALEIEAQARRDGIRSLRESVTLPSNYESHNRCV